MEKSEIKFSQESIEYDGCPAVKIMAEYNGFWDYMIVKQDYDWATYYRMIASAEELLCFRLLRLYCKFQNSILAINPLPIILRPGEKLIMAQHP